MVGVIERTEPKIGDKVFFVDRRGQVTRNYTKIAHVWGYDPRYQVWCVDDPYENSIEIYRSEGVWKQKYEGEMYL